MVLAALFVATAQGPTFEVVSIKPAAPDQNSVSSRGGPGSRTPGTWTCRNMSLHNLITIAYDARMEGQLVAPKWAEDLRFDIDAKVPTGAPKDSLRPMLREMLANRFALRVHTQPKEVQGYALVIAKNGPKLAEAAPENSAERPQPGPDGFYRATLGPDGFPAVPAGVPGDWSVQGRVRAQWYRISTAKLADNLISSVGKPVENGTGLNGLYDVSLYWLMNPRPEVEPSGPDIFEALQQQLGLKLEPQKITIQTVIVDHLEKLPTAN